MKSPWLLIEVPGLAPYEVVLQQGVNKVGRAMDNTIGLRDMNVSRYHFNIEVQGRACILRDLGSRNGTIVNGSRVDGTRPLTEGDRIAVGGSHLVYFEAREVDPLAAQPRVFEPMPPGAPTPNPDAGPRFPFMGDPLPGVGMATQSRPFIPDFSDAAPKDFPGDPLAATTKESPNRDSPPKDHPQNAPAQVEISERARQRPSSLFLNSKLFVESQSHRDRWQRISEIASILGSEHDLSTLLDSILDALMQLVPARGGFLVLVEGGDNFKLEVARNVEADEVADQEGRYRLSTQICKQAVQERRAVLTEHAQEDEELASFRSVANLQIESVLCMPFGVRDQVLGVVYLDKPKLMSIGQEDELLEIVTAFGNLAGIAVWNAQLLANARQQERLEQELRVAARIQRSLLPRAAPIVPGLELDGRSSPAKEIGGDLYDFVLRRDDFGDLLIGIGDVSGKGVGAGLVGSSTRSLLRAYAAVHKRTDEILIALNKILAPDLEPGIFVSFLLIRVDLTTGEAFYTGAGHEHLIIYRARTRTVEKLPSGGTVLGLANNLEGRLEEKPLTLDLADMILLYTDGVTEATDTTGDEFGINRVGQVMLRFAQKSPAELVHAIYETVLQFHGRDAEQEDDITIVAFRRVEQSPASTAPKG